MLHSNELHCIVPKLSLSRSVFSLCLCIQLRKYACIVSEVLPFPCLSLQSQYLRSSFLPYYNESLDSHSSQNMPLSNSKIDVEFKIFTYHVMTGFECFQK